MITGYIRRRVNMSEKFLEKILDMVVPFGPFLRRIDGSKPFVGLKDLILYVIPTTFFMFWLFSLIPVFGTVAYMIVLVPPVM